MFTILLPSTAILVLVLIVLSSWTAATLPMAIGLGLLECPNKSSQRAIIPVQPTHVIHGHLLLLGGMWKSAATRTGGTLLHFGHFARTGWLNGRVPLERFYYGRFKMETRIPAGYRRRNSVAISSSMAMKTWGSLTTITGETGRDDFAFVLQSKGCLLVRCAVLWRWRVHPFFFFNGHGVHH